MNQTPTLLQGYELLLSIAGDCRYGRRTWLGRGPGYCWIQGIPKNQFENHYKAILAEAGWEVIEQVPSWSGDMLRLSLRHVTVAKGG